MIELGNSGGAAAWKAQPPAATERGDEFDFRDSLDAAEERESMEVDEVVDPGAVQAAHGASPPAPPPKGPEDGSRVEETTNEVSEGQIVDEVEVLDESDLTAGELRANEEQLSEGPELQASPVEGEERVNALDGASDEPDEGVVEVSQDMEPVNETELVELLDSFVDGADAAEEPGATSELRVDAGEGESPDLPAGRVGAIAGASQDGMHSATQSQSGQTLPDTPETSVEEVADAIMRRLANGAQQARLVVGSGPERVVLWVRLQGEHVDVRAEVADQERAKSFETEREALEASLKERGFSLGDLSAGHRQQEQPGRREQSTGVLSRFVSQTSDSQPLLRGAIIA